jgi:hypothetical protein
MQQTFDRQGTPACAKGTLSGLTRTGGLLMGAILACLLLVDPPIPADRADAPSAAPYVPASDTWIEPGVPPSGQAPHAETFKASSAVAPEPAHRAEQKQLRRKPRDRSPSRDVSGRAERWRKAV